MTFNLYAWLDSDVCRGMVKATWYRDAEGTLHCRNLAGRVHSLAPGRMPLDLGYGLDPAALGWTPVPMSEVEPPAPVVVKRTGTIGYGGWVWNGTDGWSGLHLFLTETEHRAVAASVGWSSQVATEASP